MCLDVLSLDLNESRMFLPTTLETLARIVPLTYQPFFATSATTGDGYHTLDLEFGFKHRIV